MAAEVHVVADVVQQRRHLQQERGARSARPCSARSSSKRRTASCGHLAGVGRVLAVLLAQRGRAGQHLAAEVLDALRRPPPATMSSSRPARSEASGTVTSSAAGLQQQLAVGEQRGHQRLRLRLRRGGTARRAARRRRRPIWSQKRHERLARDHGQAVVRRPVAEDLRGGEAHVAAQGDEVLAPRAAASRAGCRPRRCGCGGAAAARPARGCPARRPGSGACGWSPAGRCPEWMGCPLRRNEMSALPPPTSTSSASPASARGMVAQRARAPPCRSGGSPRTRR